MWKEYAAPDIAGLVDMSRKPCKNCGFVEEITD
jgi:hypothetical protein